MGNIQKWSGISPEAAQLEKELIKKSAGGAEFLKLSPGKTVVRFLPGVDGKQAYVRVMQHFIRMPGSSGPTVFNCPRAMANKPCAACAYADELRSSGNPADRDRAWEARPKMRVFYNVIDRANPEAGPKVLAVGTMIHEALMEIARDPQKGGDFTDPTEDGFDVIIDREGSGKQDTAYSVAAARKNSELGDDGWLMNLHDLEQYAKLLSDEEMEAKMAGEAPPTRGRRQRDDEEEERPARRAIAAPAVKTTTPAEKKSTVGRRIFGGDE